MRGSRLTYSADELAWIEEAHRNPIRPTRPFLHGLFCAKFGRSDVSLDNFKALCFRRGWSTGNTGRYDRGSVPANKGKPCAPGTGGRHPNAQRAHFKKGQIPHTFKGAGHERIDSKDGYVILIVDEKNPWSGANTRPVHKHRWLWEQKHGPIPRGHVLKCLDGDKTNCDPSNWEAIPREVLPRLNGRFGMKFDQAEPEVKPVMMTLAKLKHAAHTSRKAGAR